jgi:hypothetical protein
MKKYIPSKFGKIRVEYDSGTGHFSVMIRNPKCKIGKKSFAKKGLSSWISFTGEITNCGKTLIKGSAIYSFGYQRGKPWNYKDLSKKMLKSIVTQINPLFQKMIGLKIKRQISSARKDLAEAYSKISGTKIKIAKLEKKLKKY